MRILLLLSILTVVGSGDTPNTVESLQAEVDFLKAQIKVIQLEREYERQVCTQMDLMQARLSALNAGQKFKASQSPETPKQ